MNREEIISMARVSGCHDNGEEFRFVELRYLERFAALVAAAERPAVPDGWKLVPVEPTDEMLSAKVNIRVPECVMPGGVTAADAYTLANIWACMIAEAPQQGEKV